MRLPIAGDKYLDDKGNVHTITEVKSMFDKPCIVYEESSNNNFAMFNHYIDIKALHLHSSNEFWFKEPLTDSL